MSGIEISRFVFRLAALLVWIEALATAAFLPAIVAMSGDLGRASLNGWFLGVALQVILGTCLWTASPALARRTLDGPSGGTLRSAAELGALALRLAGIWLAERSIHQASNVVSGSGSLGLAAGIVGCAVPALGAATLLLGAGPIARKMFGLGTRTASVAAELQPIAFSVVGLLLFVSSFAVFLSNAIASEGWFEEDRGFYFSGGDSNWTRNLATLLRMALGLTLFLGGVPLARAWRWIRIAGLDQRAPPA